jgi:hypothetical protein
MRPLRGVAALWEPLLRPVQGIEPCEDSGTDHSTVHHCLYLILHSSFLLFLDNADCSVQRPNDIVNLCRVCHYSPVDRT